MATESAAPAAMANPASRKYNNMQQGLNADVATAWPPGATALPTRAAQSFAARNRAALVRLAVASGVVLFVLVWLLHLNYTSLVPPVDDLEQLTWVRSLEWGYYKHPPLPTWLLWLPVRALGWNAWTVYLVGATTTVASLLLMWRLVDRLRGERHALVALLCAACITYYTGRLNYYNHNVVLMLLNACSAAVAWRAFHGTGRHRWWIALGVCLGLGALAKYQVVVTYTCVVAFAVHQRFWENAVQRRGMLLATLIALLIFSPHLQWLRSHDFGPVRYAMSTSLGADYPMAMRTTWSVHWLADQLLNRALPAWLLLSWVAWTVRGRTTAAGEAEGNAPSRLDARALLLAFGLVPLVFMSALGLASGADLQLHWGTPFLLFVVPAVMELVPRIRWDRASLPRLLAGFVVVNVLLLTISHVTSPRGPHALRDTHWRTFDPRPVAHALEAFRGPLGGPIRMLSGPPAVAAAVALVLPDHPLVLIDGRRDVSPWVPKSLEQSGAGIQIGPAKDVPGGQTLDPVLPGWSFRAIQPDRSTEGAPVGSAWPADGPSGIAQATGTATGSATGRVHAQVLSPN